MYLGRLSRTLCLAMTMFGGCLPASAQQPQTQTILVDSGAPATPFPHFWEQTFGSGRAILALRDSYRSDVREVKKVTEFSYVRFHAILHDEVGVYDEDKDGNAIYNFTYVDQIYDGLLKDGVRPFVEISFMPKKLAAREAIHPFWYKQNVAPPKDYAKWDALMRAFTQHLVDRYGIDEVSQWYFEVWNEPNIDFWAGEPKQATYFELYEHTARALKSVNPRIRVGGPSTAAADWVDVFVAYCAGRNIPLDFVSSHGYADDTVENLLHTHEAIPMNQRVCRAIRKVRDQIAASPMPGLPLFWTEWNVPSYDQLNARDTIYVGAALAETVRQCDGVVKMMSFWTFDDVFEENGVAQNPFHGGFGLIAADGIRKPSYNGFALLHRLGHIRLANPATNVIVTRDNNGKLVLALWNLVEPGSGEAGATTVTQPQPQPGVTQHLHIEFRNLNPNLRFLVRKLDSQHGNTLAAYEQMGKPQYPTQAQIRELNRASELGKPESVALYNGAIELDLTPNELAILEGID